MGLPSLAGLLSRTPGFERLRSAAVMVGQPAILASLVVAGSLVGLRSLGIFERPGLALYDQFIRLQPDRAPDERLLVVSIDEADLQQLNEWPLSDLTLAQTLEALQSYQPRVIGVDILRDIPIGDGRDRLLAQLQATNVLTVCKVNAVGDLGAAPPAGLARDSVVFSDLVIDPGGTLRRSLLYLNPPPPQDTTTPSHTCNTPDTLVSLSFGTALSYLEGEGIFPGFTEDDQLLLGATPLPALPPNFGSYQGADVAGYQTMLRYRAEENSVPTVSLSDVLARQVEDNLIRDRIVLIGYTTPLAKDNFYTPYSIGRTDQQDMPGVFVHAQSASQILSVALEGQSLITAWPLPAEILWIGGWSLIAGLLAGTVKRPSRFIVGILGLGGSVYGLGLLLFLQGVWVPLVPVLISLVITSSGVILLERFNSSEYGEQFVKTVKTMLHIDIDEEQLHQQVSEITETDYFQDLQSTVKVLRAQSNAGSNSPPDAPSTASPAPPSDQENYDFLADIAAEAQQIKGQRSSTEDE